MTSPETSYTKNIANELSFLLVTHMTHFNIQFGCDGFFKSGYGDELILDRLMQKWNSQVWGPKMSETR
jgi:hypothetical protein